MKNLTQQKKQKPAKEFFNYIEKYLKDNNGKYPKYTSSKFEYYKDVFMNLLICQEGLCAYSEMKIYYDLEYLIQLSTEKFWKTGRFQENQLNIDADIEHFKAKSLCESGCDWDWNNLFLVSKHINQKKGNKPVFDFMRPDNPEYSPQKYLKYNPLINRFTANPALDAETQKKVNEMLTTLGINSSDTVVSKRRATLKEYLNESRKDGNSFSSLKSIITEFHTAFIMSEKYFEEESKNILLQPCTITK